MSTSLTHSQSLRFLLLYDSSSDEVLNRQRIQSQSGSVCPFTGKPHYTAGSEGKKKPSPPAMSRITTWSGCTITLSCLPSSSFSSAVTSTTRRRATRSTGSASRLPSPSRSSTTPYVPDLPTPQPTLSATDTSNAHSSSTLLRTNKKPASSLLARQDLL
jgi:hypothetical protein